MDRADKIATSYYNRAGLEGSPYGTPQVIPANNDTIHTVDVAADGTAYGGGFP